MESVSADAEFRGDLGIPPSLADQAEDGKLRCGGLPVDVELVVEHSNTPIVVFAGAAT